MPRFDQREEDVMLLPEASALFIFIVIAMVWAGVWIDDTYE